MAAIAASVSAVTMNSSASIKIVVQDIIGSKHKITGTSWQFRL
jgi:hypothetical protein